MLYMFTDFHAYSGFSEFSKPDPDFKNSRFKIQCEALEYVLTKATESQSPVIFGGDLFHTRQKVPVFDFNKIYSIFAKFNTIPVYLLRGNHDSINNLMGSESSIDTFQFLDNVQVISNPTTIQVEPNVKAYFMPYGEDTKAIKEKLKEFGEDKPGCKKLLVGHLGIQGATINGTVSDSPLTTGDFYPDNFDFIYMGHYHKRQNLDGRENFIYGGSTLQNSFSDSGQGKGYDVLDFEPDKVKDDFHVLTTPKFYTVDKWDEKANELVKTGNYVRAVIPADKIQEVKDSDVDMTMVRTEPVKDFKLNSRIGITTDDTSLQVVNKYLKQNSLEYLKYLAKTVLGTI